MHLDQITLWGRFTPIKKQALRACFQKQKKIERLKAGVHGQICGDKPCVSQAASITASDKVGWA